MTMYNLPDCNYRARVIVADDEKTLYSYETVVAVLKGNNLELKNQDMYSKTTMKHIRAFCDNEGIVCPEIHLGSNFKK